MEKLTKSQQRHRKAKAALDGIPLLVEMITDLSKELALVKKKLNSMERDKWSENTGKYYRDKLYKVRYFGGRTDVGYGNDFDWSVLEDTKMHLEDRHEMDIERGKIPKGTEFKFHLKESGFIESFQVIEDNKEIKERLANIEESLKDLKKPEGSVYSSNRGKVRY